MVNAIFKQKDGAERFVGYSTVDYSSNDDEEIVKEVSESELNGLVPDSFEGDWKDNRQYFKLDESGKIVFDESYEPQDDTGGK